MKLGNFIKETRHKRGLTQWELSRLSGLTRSHLSRLELDSYENPSAQTFLALAKALKVSPNELYEVAGYVEPGKAPKRSRRTREEVLAQLQTAQPLAIPVYTGVKSLKSEVPDVVQYACWGLNNKLEKSVIGVLASGFSLRPDVLENDIVFVDQAMTPVHGNIVLYCSGDMFRLVRYKDGSTPAALRKDGDEVIGVVIGINRKL
ncbi:MAG: helix-turn-helix domain-containing protein [Dehalococcoidales bacterium]|nr:helix-turn-helix domain-containing protein [Dehalococcoidales bacterium]